MHILPPVPATIRASPAPAAPAPVGPVEATGRAVPVGPELPPAGARLIATILGRLSADRYQARLAPSTSATSTSAIPTLTKVAQALGTAPSSMDEVIAPAAWRLGIPALLPDPAHEAPGDTARSAAALRQSIADSALFHESRLARWVEGKLPFDELARTSQGSASAPEGAAVRGPQVALLLRGELAWEGCAWPGQDYALAVDDEGSADAGADRSCQARLTLRLPVLGELSLTVVLRGGRVAVCAQAHSEASAAHLAAARAELASRLRSGGLQVAGLHFGARR